MRFLHQMMAAVASIMFAKPRIHASTSTPNQGPALFHGSSTINFGSGMNWPSIYHARKNSRRAKSVRRMRSF